MVHEIGLRYSQLTDGDEDEEDDEDEGFLSLRLTHCTK